MTTSARLSVLAVTPYWNPHVVSIHDALVNEDGVEVTRAALGPVPAHRHALGWADPEPAAEGWLQPWRSLRASLSFHRALLRADVAILPGFVFPRRLPAFYRLRRLAGRPVIAWSEALAERRTRPSWHLPVMRAVVRAVDHESVHFLATGAGALDDFAHLGAHRWTAWRWGYAVQPAAHAAMQPAAHLVSTRQQDGDVRLLFVGELTARKGVDVLLRALATPVMSGLQWHLRIVGDGPEHVALRALARQLSLAARVEFAGTVPHDDMAAEHAAADLLVLPSRYDGWGAVVNEALEQGVPVVASDAVGARWLLESSSLFACEDHADLARVLALHVSDARLRALAVEAGRAKVAEWRPQVMASRLLALCRHAAGLAPPPAFARGPVSPLTARG